MSRVPPMQLFETRFRAMAAEHQLQLWSADADLARRAASAAIADVQRIEAKYSRYRGDSVTADINRHAGGNAVAIDAETASLLRYADQCFALSDGRFDITSGVLRRVWDFRREPPHLPDPAALAATVALIDWGHVEWNDTSIRLPHAGMEIDFGGIGKEYAADRVATICLEHGLRHGLVNLGGDVRAIGPQADGTPWHVGIRHPRRDGTAIARFDLADGALATSGDYERFFDIDEKRYCHILDSATGMPVTHWQSISVVAPLCVVAGSCATIAMLRGDDARHFLHEQGVRYLAIAADGSVHGDATVTMT